MTYTGNITHRLLVFVGESKERTAGRSKPSMRQHRKGRGGMSESSVRKMENRGIVVDPMRYPRSLADLKRCERCLERENGAA